MFLSTVNTAQESKNMAGYNANKAALFNKLRQQGLGVEDAFAQAGITDAETNNYTVNDVPGDPNRGTVGPQVLGTGTITTPPTAAEQRESEAYYKELASSDINRVDYPVKADSQPKSVTPMTYTTTSTVGVSGGGSTTIISGSKTDNDVSRTFQAPIDAKNAEIKAFDQANPSDFIRKKEGLPPLSAEERQQRLEQRGALTSERSVLQNQQLDAKTSNPGQTIVVPNTTTSETTITTSRAAPTDGADGNHLPPPVQAQGGADPVFDRQAEGFSPDLNAPWGVNATSPETDPAIIAQDPEDQRRAQEIAVQAADDEALAQQNEANRDILEAGDNQNDEDAVDEATDEALAHLNLSEDTQVAQFNARQDDLNLSEDAQVAQFNAQQDDLAAAGNANLARNADLDLSEDVQVARFNAQQDAQADQGGDALGQAAAGNVGSDGAVVVGAQNARASGAIDAQRQLDSTSADWRVRISLAPGADYLYKTPGDPGILAPLIKTKGVLYPYTPTIDTSYVATYSTQPLTHSNYLGYFYQSSQVNPVIIKGTFTAQNTDDADYVLAVIHFFRSVTKMFYGKDDNRGSPPPLVFLSGLGEHQFNFHPCVVAQFQYSLPADIDYIRTSVRTPGNPRGPLSNLQSSRFKPPNSGIGAFGGAKRLRDALLSPGAQKNLGGNNYGVSTAGVGIKGANYVPTKLDISVTLNPIQSRESQSKQFSLQNFANGNLLRGGFW